MTTSPALDDDTAALLHACAARDRRLSAIRALGLTVLVGSVWTVIVGLIDRLLPLPVSIRFALWGLLLTTIALLLFRPIRQWARGQSEPLRLARRIERRVPELRERLLTLHSTSPAGSRSFMDRLSVEVTQLLRGRRAHELIPRRATVRAWRSAGLALLFSSVLMFLGALRSDALERQWAPWRGTARAGMIDLVIEPGDTRVLQGQPLRVSVRAGGLERTVVPVIRWSIDGGRWSSASMTRSGEEQFAFVFQSLDRPMRYRVLAGTTESPEHRVQVAHRPAIATMDAEVTYPAHLQRPASRVTLDTPRLEMPASSTLRLRITATEPLASGVVETAGRRLAAGATDVPETIEITMPVERDAIWRFELMSRDGIPSARLPPLQLRAIPDEPPAARLPQRTIRATPAATVLLPYQAGDDLSLASITLQVERREVKLLDRPVPIVGDPRLQSGFIELELPMLNARIGDELLCRIEPRDIAGQSRRSEPAVIVVAATTHDAFAQARIDALRQILSVATALDGQKPEQVEPSRLAGAIRDMEALLRVAQMRAGGLEAEPIATVTDQLVIAQEHLAGGDAPAGLERVQRAMRTVRALVRQLEARAALGDALAIEQLADEAHRPARDRLTRDLRDRVRLLDIGPPGDDLPARLREIAGQDDPAPPTDLPEWYEAESASRERVRARARAEALRERPDPARLRTLRRLGGADDGWTLPVTVEFDEDRRALLSLAAGYRLIAMLPAELAPLMPGWMQAQLTVERPLVGWRAAAWDAIGRVMLVEDADEARWMIDALQPLRPMSDAAIDTLEQHILPLLPDDVSGFDREPDPPVLRRAREQLQRDLATVVLAMHEFDPEGGVQIAHEQLVTAWGRGDRPAATRACRDVAASIERLVTHRDIQAQIAQSQHGPHLRPMIDQLLELARPRAEEMNLTMAAMRMWSMLRERAVRSDPTRSQETDPAGYEDAIRLYFNAIDRARGGS